MQIVINIPEKIYTYIKREWTVTDFDSPATHIFNGVKTGAVLSEGHGRLIDADELLKDRHRAIPVIEVIKALTILEADKAESEDKDV